MPFRASVPTIVSWWRHFSLSQFACIHHVPPNTTPNPTPGRMVPSRACSGAAHGLAGRSAFVQGRPGNRRERGRARVLRDPHQEHQRPGGYDRGSLGRRAQVTRRRRRSTPVSDRPLACTTLPVLLLSRIRTSSTGHLFYLHRRQRVRFVPVMISLRPTYTGVDSARGTISIRGISIMSHGLFILSAADSLSRS